MNGVNFFCNNTSTVSNGTLRFHAGNQITVAPPSNFTPAVNIASGATAVNNSTFDAGSSITIDLGAALNVQVGGHTLIHNGDLTNNGTLGGASGSFEFNGSGKNLTNSGTISVQNFRFHAGGTKSLGGTGVWTGSSVQINNSAVVSLISNVNIAAAAFTVDSTGGGTLDLNGFQLTLNGVSFSKNPSGIVTGTGTFQTQGTTILSISGVNFLGALLVNSGTTTITNSTIGGSITIDPGATLNIQTGGHTLKHTGNLINNGTLGGASGSFNFEGVGTSVTNNGSITVQNFRFNSAGAKTIGGTGTWTGSNLQINNMAVVSLSNNVNIGTTAFTIDASGSGTLDLNGFQLTLNGVSFTNGLTGTLSGTGEFRTQGTTLLSISGLNFTGTVVVNSGTTTITNSTISGNITIDPGAALNLQTGGHTLNHTGDLINNGTLGGTSGVFNFNGVGKTVTNNGSVTISLFRFNAAGAKNLGGSGSFSTTNPVEINSGAAVTLITDHQFRAVAVDVSGGGTLDITNRNLYLNGPGTPFLINPSGTFVTTGGTVVYNGTAAQTVGTVNIN